MMFGERRRDGGEIDPKTSVPAAFTPCPNEIAYRAPEEGGTITIDAAYVRDRLESIACNSDLGSEQDESDAAWGPVRQSAGRSSAEAQPKRVCCWERSIQEVRAVLALNRAIHLA
jgi:hypothetical protein